MKIRFSRFKICLLVFVLAFVFPLLKRFYIKATGHSLTGIVVDLQNDYSQGRRKKVSHSYPVIKYYFEGKEYSFRGPENEDFSFMIGDKVEVIHNPVTGTGRLFENNSTNYYWYTANEASFFILLYIGFAGFMYKYFSKNEYVVINISKQFYIRVEKD